MNASAADYSRWNEEILGTEAGFESHSLMTEQSRPPHHSCISYSSSLEQNNGTSVKIQYNYFTFTYIHLDSTKNDCDIRATKRATN